MTPTATADTTLDVKIPLRLIACMALLTALADWLFFRQRLGINVAIFLVAFAAAIMLLNLDRLRGREMIVAMVLVAAALLALVEELTLLSALAGLSAIALFAVIASGQSGGPVAARIGDAVWLLASAPFRLVGDLTVASRIIRHAPRLEGSAGWFIAWIVPLGLGALFLVLFSSANPVIGDFLARIDLGVLLSRGDPLRPVFWLLVLALIWPLLHARLSRRRASMTALLWSASPAASPIASPVALNDIFGTTAILRSLVLFNLLFAVQTCLDVVYLWSGATLPDGMTYASYAHRGAYPLIVAALLAGAFVLAAMRSDAETSRMPRIRMLVFLWIGQTVLLVISSIFRLNLYVHVYSLTYLRVAALIWMLLVAAGLLLIIARIALGKSNGWLIKCNAAVLAFTLYVCSLVNFAGLIAEFNVTHSWEMRREGEPIDVSYLCGLGVDALPAMMRLGEAQMPPSRLAPCRVALQNQQIERAFDWRRWSYRNHRLQRRLQSLRVTSQHAVSPN
jgi:Domain of unknown function (DUF4173)